MANKREQRIRREQRRQQATPPDYRMRRWVLLGLLSVAACTLVGGAVYRSLIESGSSAMKGRSAMYGSRRSPPTGA
jgi:hypothetical protein